MKSYIVKNYTICLYFPTSLDCYVRSFHYKVLNNVLYLNKKLHFWKVISSSMLFYKNADETILNIFNKCNITKELRISLISFFDKCWNLLWLTSQTAFLGFTNTYCNDILLKKHIILVFKTYVYNSRKPEKKFTK